ncbi:hypothetical protein A3F62_05575 [Candidatus Woesebacteria bacterium RIFCSPHIGHO2_12_FULL_44_11]|nr:MAG: hypothetical protein A3F62_05575 [Candidatus Woesebacteria bacterium RIFCSPHIGHO2_12_FULL_44_11]
MKKILFVVLVIFLLHFLGPQNSFAQGTYTCRGDRVNGCVVSSVNCDQGYVADTAKCADLTSQLGQCNGASFSCTASATSPVGSECDPLRGIVCSGDQVCINGYCQVNPRSSGGGDAGSVTCDNPEEINTAVGCIPYGDTNALMGFILRWAIGVGGGIAFLLIIFAGFQIMTSSGNPERLKAGQELLTSAIAGLIMLVFSIFILRVIGVDILGVF